MSVYEPLYMSPGSRVFVRFTRNGSNSGGCVVSVDMYYNIVLDEPINSQPNQREIQLAYSHNIDQSYLVCAKINQPELHVEIRPVKEFDVRTADGSTQLLCKCGVVQPKHCFFVCDKGHYFCWKHIIPWNDSRREPDILQIAEIVEYMLAAFPAVSCLRSRCLASFKRWQQATTPEEKNKVALESLVDDYSLCFICGGDTDVGRVEAQLFPEVGERGSTLQEDIMVHVVDTDNLVFQDMSSSCDMEGSVLALPVSNGVVGSVAGVQLKKGWDLRMVRRAIISAAGVLGDVEDYLIYRVEECDSDDTDLLRWHCSLLSQKYGNVLFNAADIKEGWTLSVRRSRDNVGPSCRLPLLVHADTFNDSLRDKVETLGLHYRGWRGVRGDGNCYYRAVGFGFIESLLCADPIARRKGLDHLLQVLVDVGRSYQYSHEIDGHKRLLCAVKRARDGLGWVTPQEFEADVVNSYTRIDQSLIRALRWAVADYLLCHQHDDLNGISLVDSILPSYPGISTMQMYCDEWVLRMGVDAEGPLVDLGVLFTLLLCNCKMTILDRRSSVNLSVVSRSPECSGLCGDPLATIHLLYRPGHYDLLYSIDHNLPLRRSEPENMDYSSVSGVEKTLVCDSSSALSDNYVLTLESVDSRRLVSVVCMLPMLQMSGGVVVINASAAPSLDGASHSDDEEYVLIKDEYDVAETHSPGSGYSGVLELFLRDPPPELFKVKSLSVEVGKLLDEQEASLAFAVDARRAGQLIPLRGICNSSDWRKDIDSFLHIEGTSVTRFRIRGLRYIEAEKQEHPYSSLRFGLGITRIADTSDVEIAAVDVTACVDWWRFSLYCDNNESTKYAMLSHALTEALQIDGGIYNVVIPDLVSIGDDVISCELCVSMRVIVVGDSKSSQTVSIPLAEFRSLESFETAVKREMQLPSTLQLQLYVPLQSENPTLVQNIGDILSWYLSKQPADAIHIKLCESSADGVTCEGQCMGACSSKKDGIIHRLSACGHYVSAKCLVQHLVAFSMERKFREEYENWDGSLTEDPRELLTHIFDVCTVKCSDDGDSDTEILPRLCEIPCPVMGCTCHLMECDLCFLPEFNEAYNSALGCLDSKRCYRSCCLQTVLCCSATPLALSELVCLGCTHFYHPACFAYYVGSKIGDCLQDKTQVVCYACKVSGNRCDCPVCVNRMDLTPTGEHVINEFDMRAAAALYDESYECDMYPPLPGGSFESLTRKWVQLYTSVSIEAIVRKSSGSVLTCRCGAVYEISVGNSESSVLRCLDKSCGGAYCSKCRAESHDGITCEDAYVERTLDMMRSVPVTVGENGGNNWWILGWLGLKSRVADVKQNIQHCPECDLGYGVPLMCQHVTCEKSLGGCGMEFCYICAAPRSPILAHGNMYHRPSCPFNFGRYCCESQCLIRNLERCVKIDYSESCIACVRNGRACPFPKDAKGPEDTGKHWKILDLKDIENEIDVCRS